MNTALTIVLVLIGVGVYFLPMIVAGVRNAPNFGSISVLNIFLGWSLIGWVIALAMAARDPRPQPYPAVQVYGPPPGWQPHH